MILGMLKGRSPGTRTRASYSKVILGISHTAWTRSRERERERERKKEEMEGGTD